MENHVKLGGMSRKRRGRPITRLIYSLPTQRSIVGLDARERTTWISATGDVTRGWTRLDDTRCQCFTFLGFNSYLNIN